MPRSGRPLFTMSVIFASASAAFSSASAWSIRPFSTALSSRSCEFADEFVDHCLHLDALRLGDLGEGRTVTELRAQLLGVDSEQVGQRLRSDTGRSAHQAAVATTTGATVATGTLAELAAVGAAGDELRNDRVSLCSSVIVPSSTSGCRFSFR